MKSFLGGCDYRPDPSGSQVGRRNIRIELGEKQRLKATQLQPAGEPAAASKQVNGMETTTGALGHLL